MTTCGAVGLWALLLGAFLFGASPSTGQPPAGGLEPSEACADFASGSNYGGSGWTYDDCVDVRDHFCRSVPIGLHRRFPDVDLWGDAGVELRRAGSPCLAAAKPTSDGAGAPPCGTWQPGSTPSKRAAIGCDWVRPDGGKRYVGEGSDTAVMNCHRTATNLELDLSKPLEELRKVRRCSVIDWPSYFQFNLPSVQMPEGKAFKYIELKHFLAMQ
eukprot:g13806.t1